MNPLLENIFKTGTFRTKNNEDVKVHSETPREQCLFLQKIIQDNSFTNSIEIGFAMGISTLAITESIVKNKGTHVVIDKFQISDWKGIGLDLISQASYLNNIEFYEQYSYTMLPKFLEQNRQFDFAYIDSTKLMDWMFVDFFFLDKLLKINGIIAIDDIYYPGIKKLLRYTLQFPNYKVYDACPSNAPSRMSKKRKLFFSLLKGLPKSKSFLKEDILRTDSEMEINSRCIAVVKIGEDNRNWDWHRDF